MMSFQIIYTNISWLTKFVKNTSPFYYTFYWTLSFFLIFSKISYLSDTSASQLLNRFHFLLGEGRLKHRNLFLFSFFRSVFTVLVRMPIMLCSICRDWSAKSFLNLFKSTSKLIFWNTARFFPIIFHLLFIYIAILNAFWVTISAYQSQLVAYRFLIRSLSVGRSAYHFRFRVEMKKFVIIEKDKSKTVEGIGIAKIPLTQMKNIAKICEKTIYEEVIRVTGDKFSMSHKF